NCLENLCNVTVRYSTSNNWAVIGSAKEAKERISEILHETL
ncbi:DinI-like family protein, partial [Leptospira borgpetersenii serovar Hardjo-bovis]|nr:DinI-like family protein [Leptospira borgpetersenii serovar Hardjo-bovis]